MENTIKYSVEFKDHVGLIHKLTKKCWGRLKEVGLDDHEYEDIFQLNCIAFIKAAKAFNPDREISFGAYLGRAIYNEFNKYAERVIREKVELNLQSYEDFMSDNNDGNIEFIEVYNADQSMENDIEHTLIMKEHARENVAKLSTLGKLVVRELLSPSPELKKTFLGLRAHSDLAKKQGKKNVRQPEDINMQTIKTHYGLRHSDILKLKGEFKNIGASIE